jgi:hypothetical protein
MPELVKVTAPEKAPDFTNPFAPRPGEIIEVDPSVAAVLVAEGLAMIVSEAPATSAKPVKGEK